MAGAAVTDAGGAGYSWFTVELDTTPPTVDLGESVMRGNTLVVPYTSDEPVTLDVTALADGLACNTEVVGSEIQIALSGGTRVSLDITAWDEVLNASTLSAAVAVGQIFPLLPPGQIARAPTPGVARGHSGGVIEPPDGRVVS